MKKISAQSLQITVFALLASCAQQPGQTYASAPGPGTSPLSGQVFQDVNAYRRGKGAKPLLPHAGLDRLAREHCEYLKKNRGTFDLYGKNVSHDGSEGRSLVAMRNLNMLSTSENVASTFKGASDAQTSGFCVKLWQKSPKHDYAMCSNAWTHTGVATVVDADGRVFATQLFGTLNPSLQSTRNRFSQF
jgi:uncharacterized protein YkwD